MIIIVQYSIYNTCEVPTIVYSLIQCFLKYPDLVYSETRLSELAGHQQIHYHVCTEGVANDHSWVWLQVEQ